MKMLKNATKNPHIPKRSSSEDGVPFELDKLENRIC